MSKRAAERQLTKDDPEGAEGMEESSTSRSGGWKVASAEQIAQRKIVKARRPGISAPTGTAMPAFNFGASMTPAKTDAAASTTKQTEQANGQKEEVKQAEPMNALQRLAAQQAASGWRCETCDSINKHEKTVCGACEAPRPASAAKPTTTTATTTAAEKEMNPLQRLAAQQAKEKWECGSCLSSNKLSDDKCGACQEPRPAGKGPAASTSASDSTSSSSSSTPAASFSFGSTEPSTSSSSSASTSNFTFGSGSGGFSFGAAAASSSSSAASTGFFSFGSSEAAASPVTFGSLPTFGSAFGNDSGSSSSSSFAAAFAPAKPLGSSSLSGSEEKGGGEGEGEGAEGEDGDAAPSLSAPADPNPSFAGRTADSTGEENDEIHLRTNCKVFQLKTITTVAKEQIAPTGEISQAAAAVAGAEGATSTTKENGETETKKTQTKYVEIGSGELHVNTVETNGKTRARLVLREEKTKRSVLNAPLFVGMNVDQQGERFIRFSSLDLEANRATFLLKFREKADTEETMRAMQTCLDLLKANK